MPEKLFDIIDEIENCLREYSDSNFNNLKNILTKESNGSIKNYFNKKIAEVQNPISWLRPLKEAGFFDPKNNPEAVESKDQPGAFTYYHWKILNYLEYSAKVNYEKPDQEVTKILVEIVNDIVANRNDNHTTNIQMVKIISLLPAEEIQSSHIDFVRDLLLTACDRFILTIKIGGALMPALIKGKRKDLILQLIDGLIDVRYDQPGDISDYPSILKEYDYEEVIRKFKEDIAGICGRDALEIGIKKIDKLLKKAKNQFSKWAINILHEYDSGGYECDYNLQLVAFTCDMLEELVPADIEETLKDFIASEHSIFRRLAVHAISRHYKSLNHLFWTWPENPLNDWELKYEIYELLERNCPEFKPHRIERTLNWIEAAEYSISDEAEEDEDLALRRKTYRKKEWLTALSKLEDRRVKAKYKEYNDIVPEKVEHPGQDIHYEVFWGDNSPKNVDEILKMNNEEIAEFLVEFRGTIDFREPSEEGLSKELRDAVEKDPEKFAQDLKPFENVNMQYQQSILWGFLEAWRKNREFDWANLFDFILKIVDSDVFWQTSPQGDREGIVSAAANLIEEGTKNDSHAFDPAYLKEAEKVLLIFVNRVNELSPELFDMGDLATSVLNSLKGKIYTAMITYSLRYARLYRPGEQHKQDRWVETMKREFTWRLDKRKERGVEFSFILGEFLANIFYLDEEWVKANLERIFPKKNKKYWEAAFTGYLYYGKKVYDNVYETLKANGHYQKAIRTEFKDDMVNNRLVEHICLGYIYDRENLNDPRSLINRLIRQARTNHLHRVVKFIGSDRQNRQLVQDKIKPLWRKLYRLLLKNEDREDFKQIAAAISQWAHLVEPIDDEVFSWLKYSFRNMNSPGYAERFMDFLYNYLNNEPEKTAQLYLEMIELGIFPWYKEERIIEIVETLYEKNYKEYADKICIIYGKNGFFFLKELYQKYNQITK
jgi:hypothetical protein